MQKAFAHTAQFDALIAMTLQTIRLRGRRRSSRMRPGGRIEHAADKALRYGENPHQKAHVGPGTRAATGSVKWETHQGKELSHHRTCSISTPRRASRSSSPEPAAVVIKHTNPCGTATGATIAEAYVRAREADPLSAFGGIVGLNREIDAETATRADRRRSSRR